jgi:hypothetical protein
MFQFWKRPSRGSAALPRMPYVGGFEMRCIGTKTTSNEPCGSILFRCKSCEHLGCNQGADNACTHQAFRAARCRKCGKLGQNKMVKDDEQVAQA